MGILHIVEDGFEVSKDSTTTADVASGQTVISVGSAVGNFAASNRVRVALAAGPMQDTTIASVDAGAETITLGDSLTGDVSSGARIRVRLMDVFDATEYVSAPVAVSLSQPLVGTMAFLYSGADPNAVVVPGISQDGTNWMNCLGPSVALGATDSTKAAFVACSHVRFLIALQTNDDFGLSVGFA